MAKAYAYAAPKTNSNKVNLTTTAQYDLASGVLTGLTFQGISVEGDITVTTLAGEEASKVAKAFGIALTFGQTIKVAISKK